MACCGPFTVYPQSGTGPADALVGRGWRPLSNLAVYQELLSQTLWEGVRIVRAAGYRE